MSYGRITTVEFNSEQDAEELKVHYRDNAPATFPDYCDSGINISY